jgi:hypothetical protein
MKEKPVAKAPKTPVVLAFPYPHDAPNPKHQPDEVIELDPQEAQQLIRDGYARPVATTKKES